MDIRYETLGWQIRPLQFWKSVYPYCYLRLLKELEDTVSFKSESDNDSLTSVVSSLELVWLSRAQSSRFVLIWRVDIHVLCSIEKGWSGLRFRSESEEIQIMKDKVGVGAKQSSWNPTQLFQRLIQGHWECVTIMVDNITMTKCGSMKVHWTDRDYDPDQFFSNSAFVISSITFFTNLFINCVILSSPELRKIVSWTNFQEKVS